MELWYYIFEVKFYDEFEDFEKCVERGVICAPCKSEAASKLETYYGEGNVYDIRIYDVEIDTNEILFERNFPGLIKLMEKPID